MPQHYLATAAVTLHHYHCFCIHKHPATTTTSSHLHLCFLHHHHTQLAATTTKTLLPFLFPRLRFLVDKLQCHIVPYLTAFLWNYIENNGRVQLKNMLHLYFSLLQCIFSSCNTDFATAYHFFKNSESVPFKDHWSLNGTPRHIKKRGQNDQEWQKFLVILPFGSSHKTSNVTSQCKKRKKK